MLEIIGRILRHPSTRAAPLALLLSWAPLPFASVGAIARGWLAAGAFAVLALALWTEPLSRRVRAAAFGAVALLAVAGWGWAQSQSWPAGTAALLSPEHARLAREGAAALGDGPPAALRLSLAPEASRVAALEWTAIAAVFLAAALLGQSRRARRLLAGAIVASALFQVFFGAQQWFARSNTLWGFDLPDLGPRLRGTFVNPNHAALYFELALAVVFVWGSWSARRVADEASAEERLLRIGPPVLAWLALFAGLAFTRSRAGLLTALVGVALQGAWAGSRRGRVWLAAGGLAAGVAGVALVAWLGFHEGLGRLLAPGGERLQPGLRVEVALATLDLWGRFPVTGTGLASFRAAFPMVQHETPPGLWDHAHSELVELGATTGAVGFAVVLLGLSAVVVGLRRVLLDGERREDRLAALAALGALLAAALHGLVDFGLTIPANAVTLAAIAGAATAAATKPAEEKGGRPA